MRAIVVYKATAAVLSGVQAAYTDRGQFYQLYYRSHRHGDRVGPGPDWQIHTHVSNLPEDLSIFL